MLDVGSVNENGDDDTDLAVFVDRLAASGTDRPTALARAEIRRLIGAGSTPPGLRRLAEALAASVAELLPPPRRPSEDAGCIAVAMRGDALIVLEDVNPAAVAGAVAALLADGRRIVVTATTPAELAAVRAALPASVTDRVLDRLPTLAPAELRELRRLLATSTPARQARSGQTLPSPAVLPSPDVVAELCARAARPAGPATGAGMIPGLLADLDEDRREAVTSVARCVHRSLGALHPRGEREWVWTLLSDLIYGRHRGTFDRLLEQTAQATAAAERARSSPPVEFTGPDPAEAVQALRRYHDFLRAGGRSRSYFRSTTQREVAPVLEQALVDSRVPETGDDVARVIDHIERGERLALIDAGCAEIGIPAPRDEGELAELTDGLVRVSAAARSVSALRHDILFIAADSPVSVPDVESAEQVAAAILDDTGSAAQARHRLAAMADELAGHCAVTAISPEHETAVAALRAHDGARYSAAVEELLAARREQCDESRRTLLLQRLDQGAPRLARAWTAPGQQCPAAFGLISFVLMDALLSTLPPPDSADVVLVLGAAGLGVERLLLAAVAPRMIAAVGPGDRRAGDPTLLSVLRRATALVIRGRPATTGRIVALTPGAPWSAPTPVGRAGA